MKENAITSGDIFFTDEINFNIASYMNHNYKIRLGRKTLREVKQGKESALKK